MNKPTIKDIAEMAGTSAATVSRVMSGSEYPVSADVRRRILDAAVRLDYSPNVVSQMLRKRTSRDIGVVVPTIANPFYAQLLLGTELEARKSGYNVLIGSSFRDASLEKRLIQNLAQKQVAGILISSMGENRLLLEKIQRQGVQIVAFDQNIDSQSCHQVGFDFFRGGMLAIEHLVGLGHRRIAFLTTPLNRRSRREMLEGCQLALLKYQMTMPEDVLLIAGQETEVSEIYELAAGQELAARFLALPDRPTAIIAVNDLLAMSIIQSLTAAGLRIPQDVSIVGFDDLPISALLTPALTTIRQPALEMGQAAFQILLGQIPGPMSQPGLRQRAITMMMEPNLVIRQTTAPPTLLPR